MATYHKFDESAVKAALEAAKNHYDHAAIQAQGANASISDDGHLAFGAHCISVEVEDGKICLELPVGIGKVCLPIPKIIPNGTAAEACLTICTHWGIPTGVSVTVSALGKVIVKKSFGSC